MNMDIRLFTYIKDSDYAVSVRFSLVQIEYTNRTKYRKEGAIAVVRFYLHTTNEKDEVRLYQRNIVFDFNRFGEVCAPCRILKDTAEYSRIVDDNIKFQHAEEDLGKAVCKIIGLAVNEHYANEAIRDVCLA